MVSAYAKALREAGLINSKGRGTSAAEMTANDAAALLVAILASISIAGSAEIARKILNLPFVGSTPFTAPLDQTKSFPEEGQEDPLDAFPPFILRDAVVTLIELANA